MGQNVKDKSSKGEKNTFHAPILFHFKLKIESDGMNSVEYVIEFTGGRDLKKTQFSTFDIQYDNEYSLVE